MMEFLLLISFSFISFLFARSIPRKLARFFLYTILVIWFIPLAISMFDPFGLYPVSLDTYIIVIIGTFSFIIGYTYCIQKNHSIGNITFEVSLNILYSSKVVKIIYFIGFIIILSLAVAQWKIISLQGGMGNLKLDFFELIFNRDSRLFFIYQVLLVPMFYILCMIVSFSLLNGNFNLKTLVLLIYILVFSYVGGKRGYFAVFLQYFIVAFIVRMIFNKYRGKTDIPKIKLMFMSGIFLLGAAYMTATGKSQDISDNHAIRDALTENAQNAIIYQIGPYRALDYAIENDYIDKYGGYTYGRSTFGGIFDYYGVSIANILGFNFKQARALSMVPLQNNSIVIGQYRDWNFSYTAFYYFLFDLGWLGIVLLPFIFGIFVRYSVNLFETTKTIGSLCLIGYLFIACFQFHASWINIQLYTIPTIIICLLLSRWELKKRRSISFNNSDSTSGSTVFQKFLFSKYNFIYIKR